MFNLPQDIFKNTLLILNLGYFISKRVSVEHRGGFSSKVSQIAMASVAVGLGASLILFLVMRGFQDTVEERLYSITSHILITRFTTDNSLEGKPFAFNIDVYNNYKKYGYIERVQEYGYKAGLVKIEDEALGVIFKGVGKSFNTRAFEKNLTEGRFFHRPDSGYSGEVVVSRSIADKIDLKLKDEILIHFFQNPPRFRKLQVVGIYETYLSDYFDDRVIIGDLKLVQRLNNWVDSVAGGLEVYITDRNQIENVYTAIGKDMDYDLYIEKVCDKYSDIFSWLALINRQVRILLTVILTVVCVNIISVVLILVMGRTQMIGILKAMGARDRLVRSIFFYNGVRLITKGLGYGNLFGLGFCFIQDKMKIFSLNPHDYYMDFVPISWDWGAVLMLNLLIFTIVTLVLFLPTTIVSRIRPIQAIRFD